MIPRPIRSLLVANRGEIARRVLRTARDLGLRTLAVYSEPDADAPFVHEADVAFPLRGARAEDSYLDVEQIIDAARRGRADAIHPGYGFLAESPRLADACSEARITFVGPSAAAIRLMGDKIAAKETAQAAGVPTLPSVTLPEAGAVDGDAGHRRADRLGYPLLVKPSAGGGGKGMRIVHEPAELTAALEGARREAISSFGDGTLFLERYLSSPRHVEVQVFGDRQGNVVHLFERECSVQRRHQKIIEETPSPGVGEVMRSTMTNAAVALTRAIGYEGAGTIEFLVDGDAFFFLEMNTRLQVEHAVTEEVTGLDLVELQLHVASGGTLPFTQADVRPRGHAIEARVYAEDPAANFMPSSGTLLRYEHAPQPGIRYEDGVVEGSNVSVHYDPMIAKLVSHAPTRDIAADRLVRALQLLRVNGITTNRDLLVAILGDDDFRRGATTTDLLERRPDLLVRPSEPELQRFHAVAAALVSQHERRALASVLRFVPSGWRNVPDAPELVNLRDAEVDQAVAYRLLGDGRWWVRVGDHETTARVVAVDRSAIDLELDGARRRCDVHRVGDEVYVDSADGHSHFVEQPRYATPGGEAVERGPTAPVPGTVVSVEVDAGDRVEAGDTLVVIEAMKMEHRVVASGPAVVERVLVAPGSTVAAHEVVAVLAPA